MRTHIDVNRWVELGRLTHLDRNGRNELLVREFEKWLQDPEGENAELFNGFLTVRALAGRADRAEVPTEALVDLLADDGVSVEGIAACVRGLRKSRNSAPREFLIAFWLGRRRYRDLKPVLALIELYEAPPIEWTVTVDRHAANGRVIDTVEVRVRARTRQQAEREAQTAVLKTPWHVCADPTVCARSAEPVAGPAGDPTAVPDPAEDRPPCPDA